jgi:predicted DNA binding CopG/RHH family protein
MKSPIDEGYKALSEEIKNKINSAKIAEEKAIDFLNEQKASEANTENEINKLHHDHEINLSNQRKVLESEYDQKTKKLYSDFENKLIGERKKVESRISSNLLESIINKTSNTISGDPENKDKAMRKFLQ